MRSEKMSTTILHRSRSGVPWALWAITAAALFGWVGLMVMALFGVFARMFVDARWTLERSAAGLRLGRRIGLSPVCVLFEAGPSDAVTVHRDENRVALAGSKRRVELVLASGREAERVARRLRGVLEATGGKGIHDGVREAAAPTVVDTRAPRAEVAWLLGACAATGMLALTRGGGAATLVFVLAVAVLVLRGVELARGVLPYAKT